MLTFTREIARIITTFLSWSGQNWVTGGVAQSRPSTLAFLSLSPMLSQQEAGKTPSLVPGLQHSPVRYLCSIRPSSCPLESFVRLLPRHIQGCIPESSQAENSPCGEGFPCKPGRHHEAFAASHLSTEARCRCVDTVYHLGRSRRKGRLKQSDDVLTTERTYVAYLLNSAYV